MLGLGVCVYKTNCEVVDPKQFLDVKPHLAGVLLSPKLHFLLGKHLLGESTSIPSESSIYHSDKVVNRMQYV